MEAGKELRQQIKDALWGGIDPDGSTDTDRVLDLIQQAVVAELERLQPIGSWTEKEVEIRLTELGAKDES